MLGRSIHTIMENKEALIVASKEIGLEVNADKTRYMVMLKDQNAVRNNSINIDNSSRGQSSNCLCTSGHLRRVTYKEPDAVCIQ